MKKNMTATEARKQFYSVIDTAQNPGVPIVITHGGLPKVVVMSFEEFEGWQETMEIFSDSDKTLDTDIRDGISERSKKITPRNTTSFENLKKELKL